MNDLHNTPKRPIFLDYQSTTPVDARVLEAMIPFFTQVYGNPHSVEHALGLEAYAVVERSKETLGQVVGAAKDDIVLTSGATEANNLALRGLIPLKKKSHFVSCAIEHRSITGTLAALEREGHRVTLLGVNAEGRVDLDQLEAAIGPTTMLVSIQAVNSEIGTVQALGDIGRICRARSVPFHTDAAQGYGRIDLNVERDQIDLMSFSAHKIYGPKGIGALYVAPTLKGKLRAQITGGEQQGGLRAGTIPTPLAVGFGVAAQLMQAEGPTERERLTALRDRLLAGLQEVIPDIFVNGSWDHRVAGNLNIGLPGIDADCLLLALRGLALSTGSACSAGTLGSSKILQAVGLSHAMAAESFRVGMGRMTTAADVEAAIVQVTSAVRSLRQG